MTRVMRGDDVLARVMRVMRGVTERHLHRQRQRHTARARASERASESARRGGVLGKMTNSSRHRDWTSGKTVHARRAHSACQAGQSVGALKLHGQRANQSANALRGTSYAAALVWSFIQENQCQHFSRKLAGARQASVQTQVRARSVFGHGPRVQERSHDAKLKRLTRPACSTTPQKRDTHRKRTGGAHEHGVAPPESSGCERSALPGNTGPE